MLVQAGDVTDHRRPAVVVGKIPQRPAFGRFTVTSLIVGIKPEPGVAQGVRQVGIAPAVFGHAVSQQHNGFGHAFRQPLVNEKTTAVICFQPKSLVDHGDSFVQGRSSV